jgi:pimeloyl-[acyl-carrier protein] methyl ester esterase
MTVRPTADAGRPMLVLLHGFALHSAIWGDWLEGVRAELRAIDLPGHGGRPWDDRITDLASLARAVADQVPPGAIVVGWSLGGMVALELARHRTAAAGGLVLIATTPRFVTGDGWRHGIDPGVIEEFAGAVARDYTQAVQDFLALQVLGTVDPRATLRSLRAQVRSRPAPDPRALVTGLDIMRRADLRQALAGIGLATLVIAGDRDRLTPPAASQSLAAALPRASFCRIAGAGHAPFLSHPAVVRRALADFLGSLAHASGTAPACA